MTPRVALFCFYCLTWAPGALGQPTHAEAFLGLAETCLAPVMDSLSTYGFAEPERLPFLRDQLGAAGLAAGHTVYLADSLAGIPVIHLRIGEADVAFSRGRRRTVHRRVRLGVEATVVGPDRQLIRALRCTDAFEDVVPRSRLDALASDAAPETRPALPEKRWVRRILEPTAAATATVLGAYLFFTLRSERADEN